MACLRASPCRGRCCFVACSDPFADTDADKTAKTSGREEETTDVEDEKTVENEILLLAKKLQLLINETKVAVETSEFIASVGFLEHERVADSSHASTP
jgi:hypothetical protein